MFLELNSFSIMGFPDKDLHAMECNFLSRPMLESEDVCQIAPTNEVDNDLPEEDQRVAEFYQVEKQDKEKDDGRGVLFSSLKVRLPEIREEMVHGEEEGLRTPTSIDHKIPMVCPPAPRKPKSLPSTKSKSSRRRVLLDLSNEIESLFPPALLADFGNKIKKVRIESNIL